MQNFMGEICNTYVQKMTLHYTFSKQLCPISPAHHFFVHKYGTYLLWELYEQLFRKEAMKLIIAISRIKFYCSSVTDGTKHPDLKFIVSGNYGNMTPILEELSWMCVDRYLVAHLYMSDFSLINELLSVWRTCEIHWNFLGKRRHIRLYVLIGMRRNQFIFLDGRAWLQCIHIRSM